MKRIIFLLIVFFALANVSFASASKYYVNESAVNTIVSTAEEVSVSDVAALSTSEVATSEMAQVRGDDKSAAVAFLICWFVGGFGIHRHYLGTSSNMWAWYTCTVCGIFGIVPIVDEIVLLVKLVTGGDISSYCGNEKFFMW